MGLFDRFAAATVKTGYMRIILPNGGELSYGASSMACVRSSPLLLSSNWRALLPHADSLPCTHACSATSLCLGCGHC